MLAKIARGSYRHRWIVLLIWIVLLVGINFAAQKYGSAFNTQFRTKQTDSQLAIDILHEKFPAQSGSSGQIVFKAEQGVIDPEVIKQMTALFVKIDEVPAVEYINTPYMPHAYNQISPQGKIAYANIQFSPQYQIIPPDTVEQIRDIVNDTHIDGVVVDLGGDTFQAPIKPGDSELYGILAAVVILLISFGSVLAMGLPIMMALFGVGIGIAGIRLLSHVITLPDITLQLASMIGIGVGIDYALFIVTRYRQGLHDGQSPESATVNAINTAGRAVLFAGTTVVISLMGMLMMDVSFINGMGIGAASTVLITMFASVTLLPAVLGFVGINIDKLKVPLIGKEKPEKYSFWYRWSRYLQHHSWPAMFVSLTILIVLSIPLLSMRLGSSDASTRPESDTTHRAYDLMAEGFGIGVNGPLIIAATLPEPEGLVTMQALREKLIQTPNVVAVSQVAPNAELTAAVMQVIPGTSPQAAATSDLITTIRTKDIPEVIKDTSVTVHVGGVTASYDDLATLLQDRLPYFIAVVLALSFVLLLIVFRSVLVPLKAVIMNLLSIGAAYGVLVAIFQWGWLDSWFGLSNTGPIESFVPMIMFAILFGLSMDYEVFLLSRIKEEYDRTGDNRNAVADGLNQTARVITAAAAIMIIVFGSFVFEDSRIIKEFGLGLAIAVFLDATVVRLILVPSTMELLGKANWWFPKWLQWLPKLHIDGNDVK